MRSLVVLVAMATPALAEPMPVGSIGVVFGANGGTGADARQYGFGVNYFGIQAAWQPTLTERAWGPTVRWGTMFGLMRASEAPKIESWLWTVQMDLTVGIRFRPWRSPTRYLTLRAGAELLRANEPIPPEMSREFIGGIASVGFDQYFSIFMLNVDVRYGLIGEGPRALSLLVGIALPGP